MTHSQLYIILYYATPKNLVVIHEWIALKPLTVASITRYTPDISDKSYLLLKEPIIQGR